MTRDIFKLSSFMKKKISKTELFDILVSLKKDK